MYKSEDAISLFGFVGISMLKRVTWLRNVRIEQYISQVEVYTPFLVHSEGMDTVADLVW